MTDHPERPLRLDAETMAALMEGRLTPEERDRALEILAESDADLEVLADAAVAAAALDEDRAPPPEPASTPSPMRPSPWKIWLPVAAVLVGLALVPSLVDRAASPELADLRAELVALGPMVPSSLPAAAGANAVRSGPIGGDAAFLDSLTAAARSFRRGAAVARLTVLAPRARADSPDAAVLAALLSSSAGSAARPLVDSWLRAEVDDASAWEPAVDALASLDGEAAAFRMGLLIERFWMELALDGSGGVSDSGTASALRGAFSDLDETNRSTLSTEFSRLMAALEGEPSDPATLSTLLNEFAAAAADARRSPPSG